MDGRNPFRRLRWVGLGLLVGAVLGLVVGWVAWPAEFTEADPSVLEEEFKEDYGQMIASTYWLEGDLEVARQRLGDLDLDDPGGWLISLTVDKILERGSSNQTLHLVKLTNDLGLYSPAMEPYLDRLEEGE